MVKEAGIRSKKIFLKQVPKLIDGGEGDVKEREGKTLEKLIMRASDINFSMGATKQKGAVMPRKFGGSNR